MLIINGLLQSYDQNDEVSTAFYEGQQEALTKTPEDLKKIQTYSLPFVSYSLIGMDRLRQIVSDEPVVEIKETSEDTELAPLSELKDGSADFSSTNSSVTSTVAESGARKPSVAASIAVGVTEKGHKIHFTTTDPAAHLEYMLQNRTANENISIRSTNPEVEVETYKK